MTRAHLQLLGALMVGLLVLAAPLVLLVRAMRRDERRTRLTNAPIAGLVLLGAVSIGAWLWISMTDVEVSANVQGPLETFLLASPQSGSICCGSPFPSRPRRGWCSGCAILHCRDVMRAG